MWAGPQCFRAAHTRTIRSNTPARAHYSCSYYVTTLIIRVRGTLQFEGARPPLLSLLGLRPAGERNSPLGKLTLTPFRGVRLER